MKFKHLVDDIIINFWFSKKFASIKDIRRMTIMQLGLQEFLYNSHMYYLNKSHDSLKILCDYKYM